MYRVSFLGFFVIELLVSLGFILVFGLSSFLILVILSLFIGIFLLAIFWKNMLEFRLLALGELFSNFSYVISAFLFIVPGVLSTFLATCILIFALVFRKKGQEKGFYKSYRQENNFYKSKDYDEEIIDVEIVEDSKR